LIKFIASVFAGSFAAQYYSNKNLIMKRLSKPTKFQMLVKNFSVIAVFSTLLSGCSKEDSTVHPDTLPPSGSGASVMAAAGDSATIIGTINQFRKLLGDSLNTVPDKTSGRREVNWDAVPSAFTNANNFPFSFFNSTVATDGPGRKRGLVLTSSGTIFRIDSTNFVDIDLSYDKQFETFSRKRLFAAMNTNITELTFKVPGTATDAYVKGFGVIFSDVDNDNSTSVEYYSGNKSLGVFQVSAHPPSGSFSFLGVNFANAKVTRIKIKSGSGMLATGVKDISDGGANDLVVMDDFLYNEPIAVK
jgi:hypothetical protein